MRCRVVKGHVSGLAGPQIHHLVVEPVVAALHGAECRPDVDADSERLRAADEVDEPKIVSLNVACLRSHKIRRRYAALAQTRDTRLLGEDGQGVSLLARHGEAGTRKESVEIRSKSVAPDSGKVLVPLCPEQHGLGEPSGVLVYALAHHVLDAVELAVARIVAFVRVFGAAVDVEELLGRPEDHLSGNAIYILKAERADDNIRIESAS